MVANRFLPALGSAAFLSVADTASAFIGGTAVEGDVAAQRERDGVVARATDGPGVAMLGTASPSAVY